MPNSLTPLQQLPKIRRALLVIEFKNEDCGIDESLIREKKKSHKKTMPPFAFKFVAYGRYTLKHMITKEEVGSPLNPVYLALNFSAPHHSKSTHFFFFFKHHHTSPALWFWAPDLSLSTQGWNERGAQIYANCSFTEASATTNFADTGVKNTLGM